ncbi:hypothetical protein ACOMSG_12070 [Macellibacteroides fermentans]|uniref:hypothetical protein n=1 Tax=Macellibacteroides fermentans TaxID=879969 RepID=UPI003B92A330
MEDYNEKTLSDLDDIIAKLNKFDSVTIEQYLAESKHSKEEWYGLCQILELNEWVKTCGDKDTEVSIIFKSDYFHGLLLGGNFSERQRKQKVKENQTIPIMVNAGNNSNIAIQNTGSVTQTITITPEIENCISNIASELERNDSIQQEDQEEIIELLENIRESLQDHRKPLNSVMKRLQRYGNTIVAIAPYVELLSMLLGVS